MTPVRVQPDDRNTFTSQASDGTEPRETDVEDECGRLVVSRCWWSQKSLHMLFVCPWGAAGNPWHHRHTWAWSGTCSPAGGACVVAWISLL